MGLQIAKGLKVAHDKGIFHLDLKPANILLQAGSEVGVKIIDFGLAKVAPNFGTEMATRRSRSGLSLLAQTAVFGTLDYAPPEQQGVNYGEPSAKSDVYAFGKTLYRLLTGESPQTLHPRRLADSPELFELLCDCVETEPDRRIDLVDLLKGLEKLLSPVSELPKYEPIRPKLSKKHSVTKISSQKQAKQTRIVKIDKWKWWNQLDYNWKITFRGFIKIEPTDSDLEKIVNLQKLNCGNNQIQNLEPLRALNNLQILSCWNNQISDLEPLRTLTDLRQLYCYNNQISDLEPLCALTDLQQLYCYNN